MSINIEQELKLLIDKDGFDLLTAGTVGASQTNYYFYISSDRVVRIRYASQQYTLTIKSGKTVKDDIFSADEQQLEISKEAFEGYMLEGIDCGFVEETFNVKFDKLQYIVSLETTRHIVMLAGCSCEIDANTYLGVNDYELECEDDSVDKLNTLKQYLIDNDIPTSSSSSKALRALTQLQKYYSLRDKYTTLIFDLDGTLSNTERGLRNCYRMVNERIKFDNNIDIKTTIGPPLEDTFARLYNDEQKAKEGLEYYRQIYADNGMYDNDLYFGMDKVLRILTKQYKLQVCTSKVQFAAEAVLDKLGVAKYFNKIYGSDFTVGRIYKRDIMRWQLEDSKLNREKCALIGDTIFDMIAADNNGVDTIAVLYGFGKMEDVLNFAPKAVCDNPLDILSIFDKTNK